MNLKQKYFIDIHKGITPIFIIFLICFFNQWDNLIALIYLALHGTYGLLWITKSFIYPDKQWEQTTTLAYGLFIWLGLSLYWFSPYIITSKEHFFPIFLNQPTNLYIMFCIIIYILGIFLHFTSDMQKHIHLKLKSGTLITDYMFSRVRNTNYLGELFIYMGFTLLANDWVPILALFSFIIIIWIPNMIKKDKSLSRYNGFKNYKSKTNRIFPFIF